MKRKLTDLNIDELKIELIKRNLDIDGDKAILIERLIEVLKSEEINIDCSCEHNPTPDLKTVKMDQNTSVVEAESSHQSLAEEKIKNEAGAEDVCIKHEVKEECDDWSVPEYDPNVIKEEYCITTDTSQDPEKSSSMMAENSGDIKPKLENAEMVGDCNCADNEDSINLTIGEDEEKLLIEEDEDCIVLDHKNDVLENTEKKASKGNNSSLIIPADGTRENCVQSSEATSPTDEQDFTKVKRVPIKLKGTLAAKGNASETKYLWVSGLSPTTRATDLKHLFSKFGKVLSAKVVTNARTPGARCFGYITMAASGEASSCIQNLHKTELHGRIISVEWAKAGCGPPKRAIANKASTVKSEANETVDLKSNTVDLKPVNIQDVKIIPDSPKCAQLSSEDTHKSLGKDEEDVVCQLRGSKKSSSPTQKLRRSRSPSKPGVLTFAQIKESRERQRYLERNRQMREENRRNRDEQERQLEIERRQREEARRLEREKEKLRRERELIERERAELLRLERERQKYEKEKIEREKEELRKQKLKLKSRFHREFKTSSRERLEEPRKGMKRPAEGEYRQRYEEKKRNQFEERKRIGDRHNEDSTRFKVRSAVTHVHDSRPSHNSSKLQVFSTRQNRPLITKEDVHAAGKERYERLVDIRDNNDRRKQSADHHSKADIHFPSREKYSEPLKARVPDHSQWYNNTNTVPTKNNYSASSTNHIAAGMNQWAAQPGNRRNDGPPVWGRPVTSTSFERWVGMQSSNPLSFANRTAAFNSQPPPPPLPRQW